MSAERPLHVVSISLGSDQRDKTVELELLGRAIRLERRGTNGDLQRAATLVAELDGKVDAFGLGGTDLYVVAGNRRYVIRDAAQICAHAKQTPILDGTGLKHTLEREAIRRLDASGELPIRGKRVLLVCGVDRFGMAEAIAELTSEVSFGDLMFGLGIPLVLTSLGQLRGLAKLILPVVRLLPFKWIYPTGEKQRDITPKYGKTYAAADIIAGDFHFIRRFLPAPADPPPLAGKAVITNTTTEEDVQLLRERGLSTLVTTTPRIDGRSFGTNVWEAAFVALAGAKAPLDGDRLLQYLDQIGWAPDVVRLDGNSAGAEAPAS